MKIGPIHILTNKTLQAKLANVRVISDKIFVSLLHENKVFMDYFLTLPTKYRPDIKKLKAKAKREAKVKASDTGTV